MRREPLKTLRPKQTNAIGWFLFDPTLLSTPFSLQNTNGDRVRIVGACLSKLEAVSPGCMVEADARWLLSWVLMITEGLGLIFATEQAYLGTLLLILNWEGFRKGELNIRCNHRILAGKPRPTGDPFQQQKLN